MLKHNLQHLLDWDRTLVWHAFTQMAEYEPFVIERAEGCTLVDIDGRRYIDGVSSLWCNIHGHRHPKIDAAIRAQLDKVAHVTNLGGSNPTTIRLAKRLVDIAPPGLRARLLLRRRRHGRRSGPQNGLPILAAARRKRGQPIFRKGVRQMGCPLSPRPEKTCYLALGEAYHGDTLGSVSVGGVEQFHAMFRPLLFETLRVPAPDSYRTPPGVSREDLCQYHLAKLEQVLAEHHQRIAAMVIEPLVQAAAGMIMHPPGYLRGVRELTRKYDVLLIADEVAVGFGRTGKMFACEHEEVTPDLLCLAKGLTGGYLPMAATLATDEIWQAFLGTYAESKTFFHGHTYGGNPLGAAAALATLDVFEEEQTLEKLPAKIARLAEHLARHRPAAARRRRAAVRPDRRHRAGPRRGRRRSRIPGRSAAGMRVCDHARRRRRLAPPAGQRDRHHAAAGDHPGADRPNRRGRGRRHPSIVMIPCRT